ncbi:MAG: hypothetical protein ABI707_04270 [Ferruginibacter sp.]
MTVFEKNESTIAWSIHTGSAVIYSLTFRYANTTGKDVVTNMELIMADGIMLKKETLAFSQSKTGKWNYVATTTGTMINAGNYIIRLTAENAKGLSVTGVDIQ